MKNTKIKAGEFLLYEAVKTSGLTDMFDQKRVQELTGLDSERLLDLVKNYFDYKKEYGCLLYTSVL